MSLPGHIGSPNLRLPFAVILKRHALSPKTFDDLLEVFAWSMKWLSLGRHPHRRHDGSAFSSLDCKRARAASQPLRFRGVLVELRGDWACMRDVFRLPGWSGNRVDYRCVSRFSLRRERREAQRQSFYQAAAPSAGNAVPRTRLARTLDWLQLGGRSGGHTGNSSTCGGSKG
jgi:hypothetical protein